MSESKADGLSPKTSATDAWRVLLDPGAYNSFTLLEVFDRGYATWQGPDGEIDEQKLFEQAQTYAVHAIDDPDVESVKDDPWIPPTEPGRLAVLHTWGVQMIIENDRLQKNRHRIKLHHYLRNVFLYHVYAAMEHPDFGATLQRFGAEGVYGRGEYIDERGPVPGPTVTGIVKKPEFNNGSFVEIPITHATTDCLDIGDSEDAEYEPTRVADNKAYIPFGRFREDVEDHLCDGRTPALYHLEQELENYLPGTTPSALADAADRVDDKIKELEDQYLTQRLYKDKKYPEKLRVILKAATIVPNDIAQLYTPLTASDLFVAAEYFYKMDASAPDNTVYEYEQDLIDEFSSPNGLSQYLSQFGTDENFEDVHVKYREGEPNLYLLEYEPPTSFKQVNVSNLEDLLELPCIRNLHEYCLENKPEREPLYLLVRIFLSINPERSDVSEFPLEEIVNWFRQYPWFDEPTTRYQVNYEKREGDDILPVGCNNDNKRFSEYCIGCDECEYSIYQSLPFKQSVYDRLPDGSR